MKNIHVLPTDKPSRFVKSKENKKCYLYSIEEFKDIDKFIEYDSKSWDSQNINITSENEDINENDYVITKDGRLFQVSYLLSKKIENASKVVLTTDKDLIADGVQSIPDEFLEWFVNNPNCEQVRVVDVRYDISTLTNDVKRYPNLDVPDYKVIIPSEELNIIDNWLEKNGNQEIAKQVEIEAEELSKQETTLEEVAEKLKSKELFKESNDRARKILSEIKSLPIQERMYSEDEVLKLLEKRDKYVGNWLPPVKWLEQFKNK